MNQKRKLIPAFVDRYVDPRFVLASQFAGQRFIVPDGSVLLVLEDDQTITIFESGLSVRIYHPHYIVGVIVPAEDEECITIEVLEKEDQAVFYAFSVRSVEELENRITERKLTRTWVRFLTDLVQ